MHTKILFAAALCSASLFADPAPGFESPAACTPSSRFETSGGWNLCLDAEFLWWIAQQDGLIFAQTGVNSVGPSNFVGDVKQIKPHWEPGCRVGLRWNTPYDQWDLFLNWTYYHSNAHDSAKGSLLTLWGHPSFDVADTATFAKAHWHLDLNLADLECGRSFWVGKKFSLRPFLGLRGAWIYQNFKIHYDYNVTPVVTGRLKMTNNFGGGGIRAGCDARFAFSRGWSAYGLISYALLYGSFNTDYKEKESSTLIGVSDDNFQQGLSASQLVLGIRWDTYFSGCRTHAALYAGWEQNFWVGLNKTTHFVHQLHEANMNKYSSNLSLQGGTAGLLFDF